MADILTSASMREAALKIMEKQVEQEIKQLEKEMKRETTPHSLVVITMKDGTTQEIIIKMHPRAIHEIGVDLKERGGVTLDNGDNAILVMADQIKHINVMQVTTKE